MTNEFCFVEQTNHIDPDSFTRIINYNTVIYLRDNKFIIIRIVKVSLFSIEKYLDQILKVSSQIIKMYQTSAS